MDEIIRFCEEHKDARVSFQYDKDLEQVKVEVLVMRGEQPWRCQELLVSRPSILESSYHAIELAEGQYT